MYPYSLCESLTSINALILNCSKKWHPETGCAFHNLLTAEFSVFLRLCGRSTDWVRQTIFLKAGMFRLV